MKKLFIAAGILAISTIGASALTPPKRFDFEPKIPYKVYYMELAELRKACFAKWYHVGVLLGCTKVLEQPERCAIFVYKRAMPNVGWPLASLAPIITPEMVIRHEKGHCNGWSYRHGL